MHFEVYLLWIWAVSDIWAYGPFRFGTWIFCRMLKETFLQSFSRPKYQGPTKISQIHNNPEKPLFLTVLWVVEFLKKYYWLWVAKNFFKNWFILIGYISSFWLYQDRILFLFSWIYQDLVLLSYSRGLAKIEYYFQNIFCFREGTRGPLHMAIII
jgi:hypothetical protein